MLVKFPQRKVTVLIVYSEGTVDKVRKRYSTIGGPSGGLGSIILGECSKFFNLENILQRFGKEGCFGLAARRKVLRFPWRTPSAQNPVCAMASCVAASTTGQSSGGGGGGGGVSEGNGGKGAADVIVAGHAPPLLVLHHKMSPTSQFIDYPQ